MKLVHVAIQSWQSYGYIKDGVFKEFAYLMGFSSLGHSFPTFNIIQEFTPEEFLVVVNAKITDILKRNAKTRIRKFIYIMKESNLFLKSDLKLLNAMLLPPKPDTGYIGTGGLRKLLRKEFGYDVSIPLYEFVDKIFAKFPSNIIELMIKHEDFMPYIAKRMPGCYRLMKLVSVNDAILGTLISSDF